MTLFTSQMALLRFLYDSSLFTSPVTSYLFPGLLQVIVRERERERERECAHNGCIREDSSNNIFSELEKILGCVWALTLAACMTGECFILCTMAHRVLDFLTKLISFIKSFEEQLFFKTVYNENLI